MNWIEIQKALRARLVGGFGPVYDPHWKPDAPSSERAKKKKAFLRAFGRNHSVLKSARIAGIDRTTHYEWLEKDPAYKKNFGMKMLMATEAEKEALLAAGRTGIFKPVTYRGRVSHAERQRILCDLADGTSAFEDELPKRANVIARRVVKVKDGPIVGVWKRDPRALLKVMAMTMPGKWGFATRRERKPRDRDHEPRRR